jgi:UDP-N-acetylglucosamine--N-acetylmuramyl-(pentapeptide) pyrophosphoryl-undecaprenol N-acetylglucosamine transferase
LNPEDLADLIREFTREKLLAMATLARSLAKPDATRMAAEACLEIGESGR